MPDRSCSCRTRAWRAVSICAHKFFLSAIGLRPFLFDLQSKHTVSTGTKLFTRSNKEAPKNEAYYIPSEATSLRLRMINSTHGIATELPSARYLAESDAPGIFVQSSGKPCNLSHSKGVSLRMSCAYCRSGSTTRSVASFACLALCVLAISSFLNSSTRCRA